MRLEARGCSISEQGGAYAPWEGKSSRTEHALIFGKGVSLERGNVQFIRFHHQIAQKSWAGAWQALTLIDPTAILAPGSTPPAFSQPVRAQGTKQRYIAAHQFEGSNGGIQAIMFFTKVLDNAGEVWHRWTVVAESRASLRLLDMVQDSSTTDAPLRPLLFQMLARPSAQSAHDRIGLDAHRN